MPGDAHIGQQTGARLGLLQCAPVNTEQAIERARRALCEAAESPERRSPLAATLLLAGHRLGAAVTLAEQLEFWQSRSPGTQVGEDRYRWELRQARAPDAAWCPPRDDWRTWRAKDQDVFEGKPDDFEERLTVPLSIVDGIELLELLMQERGRVGSGALELLAEAMPICRRDYARFVSGAHAWNDTFALFALTERPRALERLQPFAIAIAACWVPSARAEGLLRGTRFPFHQRPLDSACAMLACGLLALGQDLDVLARLAERVRSTQRESGGWGDDGDAEDVLTTYVVAHLLARVDPEFDPASAAGFLCSNQDERGFFRALGPETPWLTEAILQYLVEASLPFDARFRWPHLLDANRDSKTKLPFYAYFVQLCEMFTQLPSLGAADFRVAFLDLVGFREFNNRFGQERGDSVLAALAEELDSIPSMVAIRDGGDEFLLVSAPTGHGMTAAIESFRERWPARFRERFGDDAPVVEARVLTATTTGSHLRAARELLGREVGVLKNSSTVSNPWNELGRIAE